MSRAPISSTSFSVDVQKFALFGVGIVLVGIVLITLASLLTGGTPNLPTHGDVTMHVPWEAECPLTIKNPRSGSCTC